MDDNEISEFLHSMAKANGRCFTDAQKEEFMTKLLDLWKKAPALRFGQMLDNALGNPIHLPADFSVFWAVYPD